MSFLCLEFGFEQTFVQKMHAFNVDEIDPWSTYIIYNFRKSIL